jgi:hypothetical protein
MDMSIISFNRKTKELKFAGAVNPLVYIIGGQMEVLKGDFFGIGGQIKGDRQFTQQSITITKPTSCYVFSDGFADQFGGDKSRKYMSKRFRQLLLDNHSKPMEEQAKILEETLKKWHGEEHPRVDDVLVMGFILS